MAVCPAWESALLPQAPSSEEVWETEITDERKLCESLLERRLVPSDQDSTAWPHLALVASSNVQFSMQLPWGHGFNSVCMHSVCNSIFNWKFRRQDWTILRGVWIFFFLLQRLITFERKRRNQC